MKKIRKTLSLLLTFAMVLSLFAGTGVVSFAEENDILSYLTYTITDGEVTITDCDESVSGEVVIPDTIEGYPVTTIEISAFSFCKEITAFRIGKNIKDISDSAFQRCDKLENIIVDESNNYYLNIDGVLFNKTKTEILCYPPAKQTTSYNIPDSVTYIGDFCFYGCGFLENITIPAGVDYMSLSSFYNSKIFLNETNYKVHDGLIYLTNKNNKYYLIGIAENKDEYTLLDGTVSVGYDSFAANNTIKKIDIPDSVKHIGDCAFRDCSSLENVNINGKNITIGESAFRNCSSLEKVSLKGNIEAIEKYTFILCTSLKEISLPDGIKSIGELAFGMCTSLESIKIPSSVTSINDLTFAECSSLKEISLPDGIKSIGAKAFGGCTSLKNITIPASVTSLGNNVFMLCSALEDITINYNISELNSEMFVGCTSLRNITFTGTVDTIGEHAFYGCTNLENATFNSVKNIGDLAFISCSNLKNVSLNNVEVIGEGAFAYCTELESIDLGDISSIGKAAFVGCINLESITVGENSAYIVDEYGVLFTKDMSTLVAFPCNLPVTEYVIPEETTEIEFGALFGCENLEKITIHENVYWDDTTTDEVTWGLGQKYNAIPDPFAPDYNADDYYIMNTDTVIYGITGSPAHKYAIKYGVDFVDITTGEAPEDTTAPEESTTPAETTTAETTTVPEESTTSPAETTTAPEETTTRPEESTTVPAETTTVPPETTTVPAETTTVPPETTTVPAETTTTLPETTTVPAETTTVPPETTTVSVETTTVPPETTTIPAETTTTPPETTTTPEEPSENNQLDITEDSDIVVYEESKVVSIPVKSTSEDILAQLKNENVVILDKDGNAVADDAFVGTGAKLQLTDDEGNVINEYEVVAVADVDGNGKITAADARLALRAAAKIDILEGVMIIAADANSDNKVTAADARIILRKAAGLE